MDVIILKYTNRKMYNRNDSVYITLAGILDLVRSGRRVQVIENKTGKVITGPILVQAMLDTGASQFYSQDMIASLERLIRESKV